MAPQYEDNYGSRSNARSEVSEDRSDRQTIRRELRLEKLMRLSAAPADRSLEVAKVSLGGLWGQFEGEEFGLRSVRMKAPNAGDTDDIVCCTCRQEFRGGKAQFGGVFSVWEVCQGCISVSVLDLLWFALWQGECGRVMEVVCGVVMKCEDSCVIKLV